MCIKRVRERLSAILLITMILIGSCGGEAFCAGTAKVFPDVPANAWYVNDLNFITSDSRRILEGSTDGRYYPESTLSVEQFIKCVVVAAGYRPTATGGHWAQPYIDKALELGVIRQGQFTSFSRGITRGEMATVILSALTAITGEAKPEYDAVDIPRRMADYASFPAEIRTPVCQAYHLGILTGVTDGKFHPERILTRSQATAVIRRVIDASSRIKLLPYGTVEGEDMWTDAEFQKFMASDEWKNYLNPNPLYGMVNGKLMFYEVHDLTDEEIAAGKPQKVPVLLKEPEYSIYYSIAKKLAYYAKKLDCTASVGYQEDLGGLVKFDLNPKPYWTGYGHDLCFSMKSGDVQNFAPDIIKRFPEASNVNLKYEWNIRSLYKDSDLSDYQSKSGVEPFDWSLTKYENVIKSICYTIYGSSTGRLFSDMIIQKYDMTFQKAISPKYSVSGFDQNMRMHIYGYYPDPWNQVLFYSTEVGNK